MYQREVRWRVCILRALTANVFLRVVYKLSAPAASFEPPLPSEVAQLLEKDGKELDVVMIWQFAMTYVGTLGMYLALALVVFVVAFFVIRIPPY